MKTCNTYIPPLSFNEAPTFQPEKWDEVLHFYNTKQYSQILPTILAYVNPGLEHKKTNEGYIIPHGSVTVYINQTDTTLSVKCPFLNIEEAKKTPLLRQLAEMRMYPLNLTNLVLENNEVVFYFKSPLHLCEPYKIYNVLREICTFADSYDDEFIEKFNAKNLQEPKIEPYPDTVKNTAYQNYQAIIEDGLARYNYYMAKRYENDAWYVFNITFKKLDYCISPKGYLKTQIENAINAFCNRNIAFHTRLHQAKEDLLKLKACSSEKLGTNLYKTETFIPTKYNGKKENVRKDWEGLYADVKDMMSSSNNEGACLCMLSGFYNMYYYNLVNEDISKPLVEALKKASNLKFSEAAPILFNGMKSVMEDTVEENDYGMDLSKAMGNKIQQAMQSFQNIMKSTN
ncbi:type III secretion system chaperone family protein [Aquimarina algiphila]|uniref:hypothetical protein n=1 Tax=Aquimarina algiphila TaxID=2047982 RepID=UPI00232E73DC|nr:hypothetical protein [Aquimarina algiphila]